MLISNRVDIARPRDEVFEFLLDLDRVGSCLPGAILGPDDGSGGRRATMDVKFGPMHFSYEGAVRISNVARAAHKAHLEAEGRERSGEGTARAELEMTVVEADQGSALVITTHMNVTGGIAQIGRGMFQEVAQELIEEFGEQVTARLGQDGSSVVPDQATGVSPSGPAPRAVDARKVLFRIITRQARGSLRKTADAVTSDRRAVRHGETVDLGGKTVRWLDTPHVPHNWDAGLLYEETTGTLFSSDLFTQFGACPATTSVTPLSGMSATTSTSPTSTGNPSSS